MSAGRIGALLGIVIAVTGAILAGRALSRARGTAPSDGRRGAIIALVLAPIGLVLGSVVVATADGGLGTGHGYGGGYVAITVGLIATALAGLALSRARRNY
ncbi:MAG TPA: DUF6223 family protein [Kofleriaceae bacterium]|nr:DUF6223 family protein [Kofleriaceae bacterium]